MRARDRDGATLYECGLCAAVFGDRRAVQEVDLDDEARARGIDAEIWPLARVLESLDGFALGAAGAGGGERQPWPFVELVVSGRGALLAIENVAKSLRLGARSLRCGWRIEARFEHSLVFSLVVAADVAPAPTLRDARLDVRDLAAQLARDRKLSWWRLSPDAGEAPSG